MFGDHQKVLAWNHVFDIKIGVCISVVGDWKNQRKKYPKQRGAQSRTCAETKPHILSG